MIPIRFGPQGAQLYGCLHKPSVHAAAGAAVLMCNPFGQESVRVHRLYRVLAERLALQGHSVLRFDYLGTGDADGDDESPGLDQWTSDLLLAHQELLSRAGQRPPLWIAPRLGAWLAVHASTRLSEPLAGLVLWEPVADGSRYLGELARAHTDAQRNLLLPRAPAQTTLGNEAIGFAVSDAFRREVAAINASDYGEPRTARLWHIRNPGLGGDDRLELVLQQTRPPAESIALEIAFSWTSEEALNTALVPGEALHLLENLVNRVIA